MNGFKNIPLIFKILEYEVVPAAFSATHVYFPECSAPADSMLKVLILLFICPTVTPCTTLKGKSLNNQVIFNGKSPFVTAQFAVAISPEFMDSSPKSK